MLSNQAKLKLIKELGKKDKLSNNHMKPSKVFISSVVYASESSENYLDTRIKINKNLKRKTSMVIPPDSDSVEFAIKRPYLQTFTWLRCCEQNVQTPNPEEFGCKLTDGELKLLWFNGDQFPPSITRCRKGKQTDGNDIVKVVTQIMGLLKITLERRRLLLSQRKENKLPGKRKRGLKRKAMAQRISCCHLTIVAKKLMKN